MIACKLGDYKWVDGVTKMKGIIIFNLFTRTQIVEKYHDLITGLLVSDYTLCTSVPAARVSVNVNFFLIYLFFNWEIQLSIITNKIF